MPGGASQKCLRLHQCKVHSIPHAGVNFPKDVILFPSFSYTHTHIQKHTHDAHAPLHACLCPLFIFVQSIHAPLCLACFECHGDERHLLFSAEKNPVLALRYRHPACIIHESSGNSVTSATWAEEKRRTARVDARPARELPRGENKGNEVGDFPATVFNLVQFTHYPFPTLCDSPISDCTKCLVFFPFIFLGAP